jgi:hypothetical protein
LTLRRVNASGSAESEINISTQHVGQERRLRLHLLSDSLVTWSCVCAAALPCAVK